MNWKIGMLTHAYHIPGSVSVEPSADGVTYQVAGVAEIAGVLRDSELRKG